LHTPATPPPAGTPGPRYPNVDRGDRHRAEHIITLSLADVRRLPATSSPRLRCRFYDAPPRRLPSGLPRTTPLVADALLEIGGGFLVVARILRDAPGQPPSRLQVGREARDMATGRTVLMPPYAPGLIRAAYDEMYRRQILLNAQRHARGVGRN